KSYGCQMNVYDSNRIADTLASQGYVETASPEDADLVVLNTCNIREKATEKVYSELGRMRVLKQEAAEQDRRMTIAVTGCVAQAEGGEVLPRAPTGDLLGGPQSYPRPPELPVQAQQGPVIHPQFPTEDKFDFPPPPSDKAIRARGISAFVTVQEGCDK